MQNLPIFLTLRGRSAVVVGGGLVAARRADLLIRAGASVSVFTAALSDEFWDLRERPGFRHVGRDLQNADLAQAVVCFVAAEDEATTIAARDIAKAAGVLVNVADRPELSDFIMPSIVDRSPIVIAISTGGASPIL